MSNPNSQDSHIHDHADHDHSAEELSAKKALRPQVERDSKYWLSLEQYYQDPEFLKKAETEFESSPLKEEDSKDGFARRDFLKLMGASIAMASSGCLRRPVQKIVPYVQQPEEVTLGVANYYTSTYFDGSEGLGLLVKTREGRPIKIEGNPRFPMNQGGTSVRSQASILSLYDPERLRGPKKSIFNDKRTNKDTIDANWDSMDAKIAEQLKKGSAVVLTGGVPSPSTRSIIKEFSEAFHARHVAWEPLSHEELRAGQKASYGDDSVPFYRFDKAKVIVSVDADFLGTWMAPTTFAKQFSDARRSPETMSKLVVFDSNFSLTGANADIRYKIKPSQQLTVVMALINELVSVQGKSSYAANAGVKSVLASYAASLTSLAFPAEALKKLANDLWENRGASLVVAGGLAARTAQARDLQVAVNFLNSILDNDGKTVIGKGSSSGLSADSEDLQKLIQDMNAGKVKTLIIHNTNPLYALPANLGLAEALKKVEMVVSTTSHMDEVGHQAHYIIPDNHPLENWGDADFVNGVFAIQQPAIRGMYDTRSFQVSLMTWAFLAKMGPKRLLAYETYYDYLRNFWKEEIFPKFGKGQSFEDFWLKLLQEGYVGEMSSGSPRSFKADAFTSIKPAAAGAGYELVLYPTVMFGDGFSNNISWLHELPDPVTKIVWDNYVSLSMGTAEKLGLKEGRVVELTVNGVKLELPAHIQPGLHDDVLAIAVGYGRLQSGKVANGIGQNAYQFVTYSNNRAVYSGAAITLTKTSKTIPLACTQGHHSMEGRQIVAEATFKDYQKNKAAGYHKHHVWSIWPGHQYNGHKWGMAVDLNVCTGCSACMTACQSENNIPVVGKKYVIQGREMHWIRVDRYYAGTPDSPDTVFQPVMCQHCDNAPCETVCPVLATVHTDDGLNAMVYNRCVGTRYCSNNCPYKVRRFNWFNYTVGDKVEKPLHMALNPEVGVRVRGVMEKCSFCSHRIKEGRISANVAGRELKDGDIKTACQSACPTGAIIFGDMNNPESRVSQMFKNERAYALLEEWNAAPAVRYMSKIRNNDKETAGHGPTHGNEKGGEHS